MTDDSKKPRAAGHRFAADDIVHGSVRPPQGDAKFIAGEPQRTGSGLELNDADAPRFVSKPLEHARRGISVAPAPVSPMQRSIPLFAMLGVVIAAGIALFWFTRAPAPAPEPESAGEIPEPQVENPRTELTVVTVPPGATVMRGNQPLGDTPFTIEVRPGEYELMIQLLGHRDVERVLTIHAGQQHAEHIVMEALPTLPSSDRTGVLTIESDPPVVVYFAGESLGETPIRAQVLPAGTIELEFELAEGERIRRRVVVPPDEETSVHVDLTR